MGNDLTKGSVYVDGGTINAANLNAHVDDAVLKYTAINARTAKTPIAVTDEFLINDSGTLKKATGQAVYDAVTQTGAVIQSTYGTYTSAAALTGVIPIDDTVPQIGEGSQIITLSFTPRSANSRMVLRFSGAVASTAANNSIAVAIFRNSVASAIASTIVYTYSADSSNVSLIATDLPASVATVTYSVRSGRGAAGNHYFNGFAGARYFGGIMATTLEVQEVRIP